MDCGVFLVVHRVDVGALRDEVLDDDLVPGDDREVQRSVALLVGLVEELRLRSDDLVDAVQVLVLSAVVKGSLPRSIAVACCARLENENKIANKVTRGIY